MIEYPSIINSSKAPRSSCIAFEKLDGSNFRAKYTQKQGFSVFGTRTQLINDTTPFWNEMVYYFNKNLATSLTDYFKRDRDFRNYREIIVFGEFFGENSFAGRHIETEPHKIVIFDTLVGHKNRAFLKPKEFVRTIGQIVEIPRIIYEGNLNDEFIKDVRESKYDVMEGVICKGTETNGAFCGNMWQCKIKTNNYIARLKQTFGVDWEKYGE